ncbi:MAG: RNA polymerase sigma factor [Patescibacteria group bacterium]
MTLKEKTLRQIKLTAAYHDFNRGLNLHAFFKTRDSVMGSDLVQDTFTKTWKYMAKGGKIDVMKAFLYHVLNHLIIDEYRKRKVVSLEILVENGFEPSIDDSERLFNSIDGKAAALLIQRLPLTYRKIIHMRYMQDLSLAEMSAATGLTKNTMAVQVHRGLERLKILYKDDV